MALLDKIKTGALAIASVLLATVLVIATGGLVLAVMSAATMLAAFIIVVTLVLSISFGIYKYFKPDEEED